MSAPGAPATARGVDLAHLSMVFPLPGALLFPHAVLPLHVFEPRYRHMLKDCLASDRAIAIACLDEHDYPLDDARVNAGLGATRPPRVRSLVGVGTVVAHEVLPDGRSNILLRGLGRARIDEELPVEAGRLYRIVRATWVKDDPIEAARAQATRQTLWALAAQLADRLPDGGPTLRALVDSQREAGPLADIRRRRARHPSSRAPARLRDARRPAARRPGRRRHRARARLARNNALLGKLNGAGRTHRRDRGRSRGRGREPPAAGPASRLLGSPGGPSDDGDLVVLSPRLRSFLNPTGASCRSLGSPRTGGTNVDSVRAIGAIF